jgi:tRNA pseudouridine55 synthase
MARSKGRNINGWVVLDKGVGMTSTQAVGAVRRIFDAKKAGHAGTLDPLAAGVLPIALGEATKTVPFVVGGAKAYRFTVRWGEERDTDDSEGDVVSTSTARPTREAIEEVIGRFVGDVLQTPPRFSAIKVAGERAYDLARDGEEVELAARPVRIDRLVLTQTPDQDTAVFEAECGKGTYVRALARDFGRLLGCGGHVVQLRRTRVGPFTEADAVTIATLAEAAGGEEGAHALGRYLKAVEVALDDMPALHVNSSDAARLMRGQAVLLRGRDAPVLEGPAYATLRGKLVALGEIEQGALRPTRVFNLG